MAKKVTCPVCNGRGNVGLMKNGCSRCKGKGTVDACSACDGKGSVGITSLNCSRCHGSGVA